MEFKTAISGSSKNDILSRNGSSTIPTAFTGSHWLFIIAFGDYIGMFIQCMSLIYR